MVWLQLSRTVDMDLSQACHHIDLLIRLFRRYGAAGVWVGTRFVASVEAGAPPTHKELVLSAGYDDTVRTLLYSGRPMSVRKTPYVVEWFRLFFVCRMKTSIHPSTAQGNEET